MTFADWITFLNNQGANIASEQPQQADFGRINAHLRLIPLVHERLLSIAGPDTRKFLQGQLTCDMNELNEHQSLLGSCCTHKGSVISTFRLYQTGPEQLYLSLPANLSEATRTHLGKYIVFSKADLSDTEYVGLGLSGIGAAELIHQSWKLQFSHSNEVQHHNGLIIGKVPGVERFVIWCPLSEAKTVWQHLASSATPAGTDDWRLSDIQAGLAHLSPLSSEAFIPQMLNLQSVGAVSFRKGCYTGQEVVTRLQHRGKLKKLLYRGHSAVAAEPGMKVHAAERDNIGEIIAVAPTPDGYEIQAVINKQAADAGDLRLDLPDSPTLKLLPLPYELDKELFERG